MPTTALLWLRRDLRLGDNPALRAAVAQSERLIPVYIHAPEEEAQWQHGAASRWWLHQSLSALDQGLRQRGSGLLIRRGESLAVLRQLILESGATALHWNRCYEPAVIARDSAIKQALRAEGIRCSSHNAALLSEPWELKTGAGEPYRVFTPYWRRLRAELLKRDDLTDQSAAPDALQPPPTPLEQLPLEALELRPQTPWDQGLQANWLPGEAGPRAELERFLNGPIEPYHEAR
ncbi:MAG: deoxyribodipyrimidine photo-lyase, partial [Chromatiaceae bacterium]|nr:deoxyribodipyrimidine photo-lyase [Chromatiaceae bacterium]